MRTRLWTACLACAAVAMLAAQQPAPAPDSAQPTFRTGANYVRVDMYATDDGRPLEDLKPEDVELREDGVVQKIDAFEYVRVRTATPESTRIEPNTVRESRQMAADARARVFVIFLDTYNTQFEGSVRIGQPLTRFLDRVLGPDDLVALMMPEMSAGDLTFGRRTTVIADMLQKQSDWGTKRRNVPMDDTERMYEECYAGPIAEEMKARRREKLALDALEDLVTALGGVREERKAVLTVSEGWMLYRENPSLASGGPFGSRSPVPPQVLGPQLDSRQDRNMMGDVAHCEADRLALAHLDDSMRLNQLAQRANRSNVSFYTIDPRGLVVFDAPIGPEPPPPPQQDAANLRTKQDGLRFIAGDTDGLAVVNTNQIDKAVDRIVSDLSSYYLLGYYSSNSKLDGKFRTISVTVRRPHVQVRARRGYRALTPGEVVTRPAAATTTSSAAAAAPKPLGGIVVDPTAPLRIHTSSWVGAAPSGSPGATFWIVGELDTLTRREPEWRGGAQADVAVIAADGHPVMSKSVDVGATDGTFVLQVPVTANLPSGEYAVRVRVTPHGQAATPVGDFVRVTLPRSASAIGEPVMWRRGPATGPKYGTTADPRFTRSERLRLELPTRSTTMATATVLDRNGAATAIPVQLSERPDAAGDFRWIVAEVNLAPVAAGDYAIDVTVDGARQRTEFKVGR